MKIFANLCLTVIYHLWYHSRQKPPIRSAERHKVMAKSKNRHGQHDEDKVNFGGMVTPEFKALAMFTASRTESTMMDVMIRGIYSEATAAGVMMNNEIKDEFKETISNLAEVIREKLTTTRKNKESKTNE